MENPKVLGIARGLSDWWPVKMLKRGMGGQPAVRILHCTARACIQPEQASSDSSNKAKSKQRAPKHRSKSPKHRRITIPGCRHTNGTRSASL